MVAWFSEGWRTLIEIDGPPAFTANGAARQHAAGGGLKPALT